MRRGVRLPVEGGDAPRRTRRDAPGRDPRARRAGDRVSQRARRVSARRRLRAGAARAERASARPARQSAAESRPRRALSSRLACCPGLRDIADDRRHAPPCPPRGGGRHAVPRRPRVDGVFDLLGHERVSFGDPIDWHLRSLVAASARRCGTGAGSRISSPSVVGDYKLLWEVNRHQHFVTLGQAYAYSRDSRYADAFVSQLAGWIEANPPRVGINWASSLEVVVPRDLVDLGAAAVRRRAAAHRRGAAHRRSSRCVAMRRTSSAICRRTTARTRTSRARRSACCTSARRSRCSRRAALAHRRVGAILREQLFRQVRGDGTYFEQALYYHRYTADIYPARAAAGGRQRLAARERGAVGAHRAPGEFLVHAAASRRHGAADRRRRRRAADAARRPAAARRHGRRSPPARRCSGRSDMRARRRRCARGVPLAARRRPAPRALASAAAGGARRQARAPSATAAST